MEKKKKYLPMPPVRFRDSVGLMSARFEIKILKVTGDCNI